MQWAKIANQRERQRDVFFNVNPELARQDVEYNKCLGDPCYFIDTYCVIDDTQGTGAGSGVMPFALWDFQVGAIWGIHGSRRTIVLKARQLGLSWLVCAYELWRALFLTNQLILLFSIGDEEAKELLRRIANMYERLPEWLQKRSPYESRPNTRELSIANGSRIKSLPSSVAKGSGYTASSIVLDEYAKNPVAEDLYAAVYPAIEAGEGQLIIISTAFGVGGKFHELWIKASKGENEFKPIFFPWWVRPGRDYAWHRKQVESETDPDRVKENYPANPTEAFRSSGGTRFRQDWIENQTKNIQTPIETYRLPDKLRRIDGLMVYELPRRGRTYIIGADTAEGIEGGDYDDCVIIDPETWVEVASLNGRWEPDEFAKYLIELSESYFRAMVAVERNNHGSAVLATFRLLGFPDVVMDSDGAPGLQTNLKTKPLMIDLVAEALRDDLCAVRTQATLDEMLVYRREPNGSTSAPSGYHDDRIISWAKALWAARQPAEDYSTRGAVEIKLEKRPIYKDMTDPELEWHRQTPEMLMKHARTTTELGTRAIEFGRVRERRNFYGR